MKPYSCLMITETLEPILSSLKANDCAVERRKLSGTVEVRDGESSVLMAIQKGYGQPWIVTFFESDRIKWKTPKIVE